MRNILKPLLVLALLTPPVSAHYHMLLPQSASVKKGEAVTIDFQWGHPFEHQLFDAQAPAKLMVHTPDGKTNDLTKALEKVSLKADKKEVTGYRLRYTPEERGDHVFLLTMPPIWMEEEKEFIEDSVKVVLHVQAQKGWDAYVGGKEFDQELVPLTRPYGLQPGMVFQAHTLRIHAGERVGGFVEIERYNPTPPKELPADEHMTRTAKTDPNGVVTCTLTEPGWWCIAAQRDGGKKEREGKSYPVKQRATMWVFVDEKLTPPANK